MSEATELKSWAVTGMNVGDGRQQVVAAAQAADADRLLAAANEVAAGHAAENGNDPVLTQGCVIEALRAMRLL